MSLRGLNHQVMPISPTWSRLFRSTPNGARRHCRAHSSASIAVGRRSSPATAGLCVCQWPTECSSILALCCVALRLRSFLQPFLWAQCVFLVGGFNVCVFHCFFFHPKYRTLPLPSSFMWLCLQMCPFSILPSFLFHSVRNSLEIGRLLGQTHPNIIKKISQFTSFGGLGLSVLIHQVCIAMTTGPSFRPRWARSPWTQGRSYSWTTAQPTGQRHGEQHQETASAASGVGTYAAKRKISRLFFGDWMVVEHLTVDGHVLRYWITHVK